MKSIKNLSQIVSLFSREDTGLKPLRVETVATLPPFTSALKTFYKQVTADAIPSSGSSQAKGRMPEKLENMLLDHALQQGLFSDFQNDYDHARYRCMRNTLIAQLLVMKGLRMEARPLMVYALRSARKHQLTSTELEVCRLLRYDAALSGNRHAFRKYYNRERYLETLLAAEMRAEESAHYIVLALHHKFSYSVHLRSYILKAYNDIIKQLRRFPSHSMHIYHYRISIRYFLMARKPDRVVRATRSFQQYILKHPTLLQQARLSESALYAMDACLELRNLHEANIQAKLYGQYIRPSTVNWFVFQELWLMLSLHAQDYEQANHIYQRIISSEAFKKLDEPHKERWKLFKVYLKLALFHTGELQQMKPLRLLNDLPGYSTDKRGLNFPILVAELICLLARDYSDQLVDYEERFRTYVKRYVNRKNHYRTWYFAKLIMLMFKYRFDKEKCLMIGEKFHNKLTDFNKRKFRDYEMIEIIPYEHLWIQMTDLLSKSLALKKSA